MILFIYNSTIGFDQLNVSVYQLHDQLIPYLFLWLYICKFSKGHEPKYYEENQ